MTREREAWCMTIALALLFGCIAGLRTFTAPAAYFLHRGGIAGYVLAAAALGELVVDALPQTPSRLQPAGLAARVASGGITGWFVAGIPGAIAGAVGAIAGSYGGHAVRMKLFETIGPLPSALVEDAIAIGLAIFAVSRL
jgi:uncharacterized membrane protein